MDPLAEYRRRLDAATAEGKALDGRGARLANLRGVVFFAVLIGAVVILWRALPGLLWLPVVALFAVYVVLAVVHDRVLQAEARARLRVTLNERGLMRLDGRWRQFSNKGDRFADPSHPYTPDLDVFGQGSLFQLVDETATRAGEEKLASWLKGAAARAAVLERQGAVRELAPM